VWVTEKPAARAAPAVEFPTAAIRSDPPAVGFRFLARPESGAAGVTFRSSRAARRPATAATAFWLVKMSQSKLASRESAESSDLNQREQDHFSAFCTQGCRQCGGLGFRAGNDDAFACERRSRMVSHAGGKPLAGFLWRQNQ
jgi:ferric-dicitrate binding protein FerR (iron transport regulator)